MSIAARSVCADITVAGTGGSAAAVHEGCGGEPVDGGILAHRAKSPPLMTLMAAAAPAALFAFVLPVATLSNAIVFASRQVTIPQMARAGIWLNLIGLC